MRVIAKICRRIPSPFCYHRFAIIVLVQPEVKNNPQLPNKKSKQASNQPTDHAQSYCSTGRLAERAFVVRSHLCPFSAAPIVTKVPPGRYFHRQHCRPIDYR
jgi:hypothetical protein